jgi:hypothetical protein
MKKNSIKFFHDTVSPLLYYKKNELKKTWGPNLRDILIKAIEQSF